MTLSVAILIGGSGTRLFPLSTPSFPKQFLNLTNPFSLFQNTILRMLALNPDHLYLLVNQNLYNLAKIQLDMLQLDIPVTWILEPVSRNTAPILYHLASEVSGPLLIVPSDHILDTETFRTTIISIPQSLIQENIITLGIQPTHPETGYGYILNERGHILDFIEKPDISRAQQLIRQGALWNAGIFYTTGECLEREFETHAPNVVIQCCRVQMHREGNVIRLSEDYQDCPNISIDYAVMEKSFNRKTVAYTGQWTDIGSWKSLYDYLRPDGQNHVEGEFEIRDCQSCLFINRSRQKGYFMGLKDMAVIMTDDRTMMIPLSMSQRVKEFA